MRLDAETVLVSFLIDILIYINLFAFIEVFHFLLVSADTFI